MERTAEWRKLNRVRWRARITYVRNRFEQAVRVHEMKGAMDPETWEDIEQRYQRSRRLMDKLFDELVTALP